jgi:hypothetical protein
MSCIFEMLAKELVYLEPDGKGDMSGEALR